MNVDAYKGFADRIALSNLVDYYSMQKEDAKSFTYNDLNEAAKKVFGKDFNLEDKEYYVPLYKYDEKTKIYSFDETNAFGCTAGEPVTDVHLYKAVKTDKQISLYESVIYSHVENEDFSYYSDSALTQQIDNCYDVDSKECHNKSVKYKFVFTLEDDNYILTDIQKVEE